MWHEIQRAGSGPLDMALVLSDEEGLFTQVESHTGIQAKGAQGKKDKLSIGRTLFV